MDISIQEIIKQKQVYAVYQPIFNLRNGLIYGYEGLIRGPEQTRFHKPFALFQAADEANLLLEMEYLARKTVISNFTSKTKKLFINVNSRIFEQENQSLGLTKFHVKQANLDPSLIVIELTEYSTVNDQRLIDNVTRYRHDQFQIAIDDFGIGNSDMKRFFQIRPNILKLDISLIRNIDSDDFKRSIVKAFVDISHANGIKILAEGVETAKELTVIQNLNVDFVQGYYLSHELKNIHVDMSLPYKRIQDITNQSLLRISSKAKSISAIVNLYPTFQLGTKNHQIDEFFQQNLNYRSIAIVDHNKKPIGLVTRYHLYTVLSRAYGRELFLNKTVESIMYQNPFIVESNVSILEVSQYAMDRNLDNIYQDVIVKDSHSGVYMGIVTIKDLLNHVVDISLKRATSVNPLTNLPGNLIINEKLRLICNLREVCVFYFDLNRFKDFNDKYGFDVGDKIILGFANILKEEVLNTQVGNSFLGHIGGDDFIAISSINLDDIDGFVDEINLRFQLFQENLFPNEKKTDLTSIATVCLYIEKENKQSTVEMLSQKLATMKTIVKQDKSKSTHIIASI